MRLSLCLLTWNEIEGCRFDVPRLPLDAFEEVFALDNSSTDGTAEYLESQGIRVVRQSLPTYNGAYRSAFDTCTTDALVIFHPKGSIDPSAVLAFRPLFERGADLVVASRIGQGARNEEDAQFIRHRKWFVMGIALVAAALWRREGTFVWDVLHGFRGMRRDAFFAIDPLPRGVSMDLEMVARAYRGRWRARHSLSKSSRGPLAAPTSVRGRRASGCCATYGPSSGARLPSAAPRPVKRRAPPRTQRGKAGCQPGATCLGNADSVGRRPAHHVEIFSRRELQRGKSAVVRVRELQLRLGQCGQGSASRQGAGLDPDNG